MMSDQPNNPPTVFVGTMGTRPEVITLTLDELLYAQFDEVCIIHTCNEPDYEREAEGGYTMHRAVKRLDAEFVLREQVSVSKFERVWNAVYKADRTQRSLVYRRIKIECEGKAVRDVETQKHSTATYVTLYDVFRQYKQRGATIHCSIAGGRKSMAVSAMSAAQILFDGDDRIWHLVSEEEFTRSDAMHERETHQSSVIPIETFTLSEINPVLAQLITYDTPHQAIEKRKNLQYAHERHIQRQFVMRLSDRHRAILQGLAEGLTNSKISQKLPKTRTGKSLDTKKISEAINIIYTEYMNDSGYPDDEGRWDKRTFLAIHFHDFFTE